ncbi:MAG: CRISPR-associated protein, Csm2 family [Ignavibacteriae bacterium]|nr:MAG: CRISPR-associated protein, Csm2 family [Ignavibacteriota bacterium]
MPQTQSITIPTDIKNFDPDILDEYCRQKGKLFAQGDNEGKFKVSSSKLRSFFTRVTSMRTYYRNPGKITLERFYEKLKREIILLKPTLAYAYGREKDLKYFYEETISLINNTINSLKEEFEKNKNKKEPSFRFDSLENFFSVLEGFVAYHKFYGGKE